MKEFFFQIVRLRFNIQTSGQDEMPDLMA